MAGAAPWDITVAPGATFDETYTYYQDNAMTLPVSLVGCGARCMVRVQPDDAVPLISVSAVPNLQGQINLGGIAGTIQVVLTPAATILLTGGAFWALFVDFPVSAGGETDPIFAGRVLVQPSVIR